MPGAQGSGSLYLVEFPELLPELGPALLQALPFQRPHPCTGTRQLGLREQRDLVWGAGWFLSSQASPSRGQCCKGPGDSGVFMACSQPARDPDGSGLPLRPSLARRS